MFDIDGSLRAGARTGAIAALLSCVAGCATAAPVTDGARSGRVTSALSGTTANLVANPSLESPGFASLDAVDPTGEPAGWSQQSWQVAASFTYDTGHAHTGTRSIRIDVTFAIGDGNGDARWAFDAVDAAPGTRLVYRDFFKANVPTRIVAAYWSWDIGRFYRTIATVPPQADWSPSEVAFVVPDGAANVSVYHLIDRGGTLEVDDVSLASPAPVDLSSGVPNGAFEQSQDADSSQPLAWHPGSWGQNTATFGYAQGGHTGLHSATVSVSGYASGDAKWYFDPQPVTPGVRYVYDDYYLASVPSFLTVRFTMGDGSFAYGTLGTLPASSTFALAEAAFVPPAGAVAATMFHRIAADGTLQIDDASLAAVPAGGRHALGGTVVGLSGSGLVLSAGGQPPLAVAAGTPAFQFPVRVGAGTAYAVDVAQQPVGPAQRCTVANATGSVGSADASSVVVTCQNLLWSPDALAPATSALGAVWGSGAGDVWAVGASGTALHWDGQVWSEIGAGSQRLLRGVWGSAPDDVWAVGNELDASGTGNGAILHWDGNAWTSSVSSLGDSFQAIWGSAANDVWTVGQYGAALHWDGSAWTPVDSASVDRLDAVWGTATDDVWAAGEFGTIVHWDGSAWSPVASGLQQLTLHGLWGSASNDVWAVGQAGIVLHWDGGSWAPVSRPTAANLVGVWGAGADDVWAVGDQGTVVHWNGSAWFPVQSEGGADLAAVWGTGSGDAWAAGSAGTQGAVLRLAARNPLPGGADCSANEDCASGLCGVGGSGHCCSTACASADASCAASDCDATGACAYPAGASCGAQSCASSILTGGTCDAAGACIVGAPAPCPNHLACESATSCFAFCSFPSNCAPGFHCGPDSAGACTPPAATGERCYEASDCIAGDACLGGSLGDATPGVCTSQAVDGMACTENDQCASGVCGVSGTGHCCRIGVACNRGDGSCGATDCDETGACNYPASDTACAAPQCVVNIEVDSMCDGQGTCRATSAVCAGNLACGDGSCLSSCQKDQDCVSGFSCVGGGCQASASP